MIDQIREDFKAIISYDGETAVYNGQEVKVLVYDEPSTSFDAFSGRFSTKSVICYGTIEDFGNASISDVIELLGQSFRIVEISKENEKVRLKLERL